MVQRSGPSLKCGRNRVGMVFFLVSVFWCAPWWSPPVTWHTGSMWTVAWQSKLFMWLKSRNSSGLRLNYSLFQPNGPTITASLQPSVQQRLSEAFVPRLMTRSSGHARSCFLSGKPGCVCHQRLGQTVVISQHAHCVLYRGSDGFRPGFDQVWSLNIVPKSLWVKVSEYSEVKTESSDQFLYFNPE